MEINGKQVKNGHGVGKADETGGAYLKKRGGAFIMETGFQNGRDPVFEGFDREMIPFFLDLRFHNDKRFMDANRDRYLQHARAPFYAFITAVGEPMQALIPDLEIRPVKCLSRINRDTRFSRDKSPYRDHLWAAFRQSGVSKEGQPFYWFEIRPEGVSWGLGLWGENRPLMDALRRRIIARPDDVRRRLARLDEAECFLAGRDWKRLPVPPEVSDDLRGMYVKRDLYFEKRDPQMEWIYSPSIADRVRRDYSLLLPLYRLFRGCAAEEGPLPED